MNLKNLKQLSEAKVPDSDFIRVFKQLVQELGVGDTKGGMPKFSKDPALNNDAVETAIKIWNDQDPKSYYHGRMSSMWGPWGDSKHVRTGKKVSEAVKGINEALVEQPSIKHFLEHERFSAYHEALKMISEVAEQADLFTMTIDAVLWGLYFINNVVINTRKPDELHKSLCTSFMKKYGITPKKAKN